MEVSNPRKYLNLLARITLILSVCLITLGGVVHNSGSSLACPDWPLCFGQVFPKMEGAVAIEHSHRLLASLVGLLSLGMLALSFSLRRLEACAWKATLLALVLVAVQGALGGLTVILKLSPIISTLHLATSQLFVATVLYIIWRTRASREPTSRVQYTLDPRALMMLNIALVLLYLQIVLGAFIRHSGISSSCGYGPEASFLCANLSDGTRSLWPYETTAQIHMIHRLLGAFLLFALVGSTIPVLKWAKQNGLSGLRKCCVAVHILVTTQVILGVLTLWTYIGFIPVTLHLFIGTLLWLNLFGLRFAASEGLKKKASTL